MNELSGVRRSSHGLWTNLREDGLNWVCVRVCVFSVASNLLKCSLNGEGEIRTSLIDLDL